MQAAVLCVREERKSLWEAARLYNIPVETLKRVNGTVPVICKPGLSTILTEEEGKLCEYLITMAVMDLIGKRSWELPTI